MRYFLKTLLLLCSLVVGSAIAQAADSGDPVRSAVERGDFAGLLALAKDNPSLTDTIVEALLKDAKADLPTKAPRAAQAMDTAAKLASGITKDAALRISDAIVAVVDGLKAFCGEKKDAGTQGCPDLETQNAILASAKTLAESSAIREVDPMLYAELTGTGEEPAQLAQQPNQGPPSGNFFVPTPPASSDSASPTL